MKMSAKTCLFFSVRLSQGLVKNVLHAALPTSAKSSSLSPSFFFFYAASKSSEEAALLIPNFPGQWGD